MSMEFNDADSQNSPPNIRPYQQEETLRRLYIEDDLTLREIGDKFDVDESTICRWVGEHDIEKDRRSVNTWELPDGYVQYAVGSEPKLYQHELVLLEDVPATDVFSDDTHCHHQLGSSVKLDIAANIDIVDTTEHVKRHAEGTATVAPDDLVPYICGEYSDDKEALSWNLSDGAPDHCLNTDDDQDGGSK